MNKFRGDIERKVKLGELNSLSSTEGVYKSRTRGLLFRIIVVTNRKIKNLWEMRLGVERPLLS